MIKPVLRWTSVFGVVAAAVCMPEKTPTLEKVADNPVLNQSKEAQCIVEVLPSQYSIYDVDFSRNDKGHAVLSVARSKFYRSTEYLYASMDYKDNELSVSSTKQNQFDSFARAEAYLLPYASYPFRVSADPVKNSSTEVWGATLDKMSERAVRDAQTCFRSIYKHCGANLKIGTSP